MLGRPKPGGSGRVRQASIGSAEAKRVATLLEMLPASPSGRALEFGVGMLYVALPLARRYPDLSVVGLEHPERSFLHDPAYIAACAEANIEIVTTDITASGLPFEDNEFDLVTMSEVIEHIPTGSVDHTFREVARVLRPGGTVLMSAPNLVGLLPRCQMLLGHSPFELPVPIEYAGGSFGHVRVYSVAEIKAMATRHGLRSEAVRWLNSGTWQRPLLHRVVSKIAARGPLSESWFIRLRKPA